MKKAIYLLLFSSSGVWAADEVLETVTVEGTRLQDVSGEEVRSADLADALAGKLPSVSLVRRSGIANDIILRGQKKDNINILIDDAKIHGACPNRMDPPTSHVLTNNIESIEITEGPYDVENFGTLSGAVKISTRRPASGFEGDVSLNAGSWGYRKLSGTLNGGSEQIRALVSFSNERGEQYEDGDGDDFAEQIVRATQTGGFRYQPGYASMDAFEKRTFMAKLEAEIAPGQSLGLSYTANRSDDVLYPSSMMDALYDDSNLLTLDYAIDNLGRYSRELSLELYRSDVDHPMSNLYRNSAGPDGVNEKVSALTTETGGLRLTNLFDLDSTTEMTIGLDASRRNWDGRYSGSGTNMGVEGKVSIDDVDTENRALFVKLEKRLPRMTLKAGLRADDTSITNGDVYDQPDNDYTALNGYLFATYQLDDSTRLFGGVGKASRVPDPRELYFHGAMGMMTPAIGSPDLEQTSNYEIDLGVEKSYRDLNFKAKLFHSWLKDYIHYNADLMANRYENVDATLYGVDLSGTYFFSDELYLDFGLAYQRGRKQNPLSGQSDRDLAEIPPLKTNLMLNYDYTDRSAASLELVASDSWDRFDRDNGEQPIDSYAVVNLKLKHRISKHFEITAGVDNLFDRTYAVSNTYKDLILLFDPGESVMLINEPGRYFYLNLSYAF